MKIFEVPKKGFSALNVHVVAESTHCKNSDQKMFN